MTEQDVINEEMYEEEDDYQFRMTARNHQHLQQMTPGNVDFAALTTNSIEFNNRLAIYLNSQMGLQHAINLLQSAANGQLPLQQQPQAQPAHLMTAEMRHLIWQRTQQLAGGPQGQAAFMSPAPQQMMGPTHMSPGHMGGYPAYGQMVTQHPAMMNQMNPYNGSNIMLFPRQTQSPGMADMQQMQAATQTRAQGMRVSPPQAMQRDISQDSHYANGGNLKTEPQSDGQEVPAPKRRRRGSDVQPPVKRKQSAQQQQIQMPSPSPQPVPAPQHFRSPTPANLNHFQVPQSNFDFGPEVQYHFPQVEAARAAAAESVPAPQYDMSVSMTALDDVYDVGTEFENLGQFEDLYHGLQEELRRNDAENADWSFPETDIPEDVYKTES